MTKPLSQLSRELLHVYRSLAAALQACQGQKRTKTSNRDRQILFLRQGGRCPYCRHRLNIHDAHVDHRIPLDRGGSDALNSKDLICQRCNIEKSNDDPIDFNRSLGRLL